MPALTESAFRKALTHRTFHRVYYFHGEDDFLKDRAVRELSAAATDAATRDFNLDVTSGATLSPETLDALLSTPPMMAERRVVIVRDVGALRKDVRAVLDRYLDHPAADLTVVLVAAGGDRAKADKALAERASTLEFPPLAGDRVPRWIVHEAATTFGVTITPDAAALLHGAVGNDLPAISAELDKLVSFVGSAEIGEAAVSEVVGVRRGETLGDFLDRVAARDAGGALELLDHVLSQPKTTAVSVIMALTTQTLALAWGTARPGRPDYFEFLQGAGSVFTGRPWGDAARVWTAAALHWNPASLDRALTALLEADIAFKETRVSSDEQLLSTLVLTMCVPDEKAPRTGRAA